MTLNTLKIIDRDQFGCDVIGDSERFGTGAVMFQGTREQCRRYIRREAANTLRYMSYTGERWGDRATINEAVDVLCRYLPTEKHKVLANVIAKAEGMDLNLELISVTRDGVWIRATNAPYGFSLYVDQYGDVKRKPRADQVEGEIACQTYIHDGHVMDWIPE